MLKIGDKVNHYEYGPGEVITIWNTMASVRFEEEIEVLVGGFSEDIPTIEYTNTQSISKYELEKIKEVYVNHCYSCKEKVSSRIHDNCGICGWLRCHCGSCKCNMGGK